MVALLRKRHVARTIAETSHAAAGPAEHERITRRNVLVALSRLARVLSL